MIYASHMKERILYHICNANISYDVSRISYRNAIYHFSLPLHHFYAILHVGGDDMSWRDDFEHTFDFIYKSVKKRISDIRFPCYGGRFYWFLFSRHFKYGYFYLTQESFIYTRSGAYITEIPFHDITKLSIKRGLLFKRSVHICLVADKKYHFLIKDIKDFSTSLTGNGSNNVKNFIETLQDKVDI